MVHIHDGYYREIAHHIWWRVSKYQHDEDWKLKPTTADRLSMLGLQKIVQENLDITDQKQRCIHLRSSMSPYITRSKQTWHPITHELVNTSTIFDWIVYEWGDIPTGSRDKSPIKFAKWEYDLRHYAISDLNNFWNKHLKSGISSWSKILSFVDHKTYPIYDSRVAMALNIALQDLEVIPPFRFQMPESSSPNNKAVIKRIRNDWQEMNNNKGHYVNYAEYLRLLDAMIVRGDIKDRLEGEMHIFGVSKPMRDEFMIEKGIKA